MSNENQEKRVTPEEQLQEVLETLGMRENQLMDLMLKSSNRKRELYEAARKERKANKLALLDETEYLEYLVRRQHAQDVIYGREQQDTKLVQDTVRGIFEEIIKPEMTDEQVDFINEIKERIYLGFDIPLPKKEQSVEDDGDKEQPGEDEPQTNE